MFVKYGFQDIAHKIKLQSFAGYVSKGQEFSHLSSAQRMRICFEELGPTFIKLGQLMASRPDIIPQDYVKEFRKLQDQIPPVNFDKIEEILNEQFPQGYTKVFSEFSEKAIGSASIAQVHRAVLNDGTPVVVKVQKPSVARIIEDDIRILHLMADLAEDYLPESKIFNPSGMVNEFARSVSLETNFVVEANNIRRFQDNFAKSKNVKIPNVYLEFSGPKVLVMEELQGLPMSHPEAFEQSDISREELMKAGLRAYFSMVFKDGLFHGDLHAGNIFILPGNQLGFIDFGMVGRLSRKTQSSIANMFVALTNEDYDRLAYEYVELAPFNPKTDRYALAQDLRSVLSPFFGLNLRDVNMGKLLLESSSVAAKHSVVLPSELMMFFKSMVTIEGLGRMVLPEFDLLPFVYDFSSEIIKAKISTKDLFSDVSFQFKEWTSLLESFPNEVKSYLRRVNQANYTNKVEIKDLKSFESTLYSTGRMIFVGMVVGALILSGSITAIMDSSQTFYGLPLLSVILFSLAGLLCLRFLLKNK